MSSLREKLQLTIEEQARRNCATLEESFWYAKGSKVQNFFTDAYIRALNLIESDLFFELLNTEKEFRLRSGVRVLRYYRGFFYVKALPPHAMSGAARYYTWFRGQRYEFPTLREFKKSVNLLAETGVDRFFLKKGQLLTDGFLVLTLDYDAGLQRATCTVRDFSGYTLSVFTPMEVSDLHENWLPISTEDLEYIRENPPPRSLNPMEAVRVLYLGLQAHKHGCTKGEMAWKVLRQKAASGRDDLYPLVWSSKPYELDELLKGYVEAYDL